MIGLAKSVLYWYENTAYEDVGGEKPDPQAPITLDRLWEVCKKYLKGSKKFLSPWLGGDLENSHHESRTTTTSYSFSFFHFSNSRSNSRGDDQASIIMVLGILWLTALIAVWILSGIAFQYVMKNGITAIMNLVKNSCRGLIGILGAASGVTISAAMWIFSNHKTSYLDYIKAGAKIGYKLGGKAGEWVGFLASIAILPVAVVATTLAGILVGLPMGALTLVVAPLQFIKTTYNYVNNKFQEELQSNTNKPQIPMAEECNPVFDICNTQPTMVWSQNNDSTAKQSQTALDPEVDESIFVEQPAHESRSSMSCTIC